MKQNPGAAGYVDPRQAAKYLLPQEPKQDGSASILESILMSAAVAGNISPNPRAGCNYHNISISQEALPRYSSNYSAAQAYFYNPRSDIHGYVFIPQKVTVNRVPKNVIGEYVLGQTFAGTWNVDILNTLEGKDFEEVLLHEVLHNIYPADTERMIREKTRRLLPFEPRWH